MIHRVDPLPFEKWHGAGNDFVIADATVGSSWRRVLDQGADALSRVAAAVCDRHTGIGADGLLLLTEVDPMVALSQADIREGAPLEVRESEGRAFGDYAMRMWNPDGSESEMCGNGLRCFATWLRKRGRLPVGTHRISTGAGPLAVHIDHADHVTVSMGRPRFAPEAVPVVGAISDSSGLTLVTVPGWIRHPDAFGRASRVVDERVEENDDGQLVQATAVSMGNPHAVIILSAGIRVEDVPLEWYGPLIERHHAFPNRTNVEVCHVVDQSTIKVRVWERGAGVTLACGTGACAVMVAARLHGLVAPVAHIHMPGGTLVTEWHGSAGDTAHEVTLAGPTAHTFNGAWFGP